MPTNWSEERNAELNPTERRAKKRPQARPASPGPTPTPGSAHPGTNGVTGERLGAEGYTRRLPWRIGWALLLAALTGVMVFASFGVLGAAATGVGVGTVVGSGHYLLRRGLFGRGMERGRHGEGCPETDRQEPGNKFLLILDDRERMELLHLLERSLAGETAGRGAIGNGETVLRGLQDKLRNRGD